MLQWIPQWKRGVGTWAEPALRGATPDLYAGSEIDFEGVAKSRPDLILAVTYSFRKSDYEKLAKIAPVVTTPSGYPDWGTPWQVPRRSSSAPALGRPEQAKQLVADAEAQVRQGQERPPALRGQGRVDRRAGHQRQDGRVRADRHPRALRDLARLLAARRDREAHRQGASTPTSPRSATTSSTSTRCSS